MKTNWPKPASNEVLLIGYYNQLLHAINPSAFPIGYLIMQIVTMIKG